MAAGKGIATIEVGTKKMTAGNVQPIVSLEKFVSVTGKGIVSARLKNYANDPFFLKKAAEAKSEIDRVGLPETKK